MGLYVELYHESFRLSLYAPFWIMNHTKLQLELRVRILIFLFLVKKYSIRLFIYVDQQ